MIVVHGDSLKVSQLKKIRLKKPEEAGSYWSGIKHYDLVRLLFAEAKKRKWEIGKKSFFICNGDMDMVGAFELSIPKVNAGKGVKLAMGILTSNSRHKALRLFVGAVVQVCSNGLVTGEIALCKKHVKGLDLEKEIETAFDQYLRGAGKLKRIQNGLRNRKLTDSEYNRILIEAGRQKLMPWSRLGAVDHEYNFPKYSIFGRNTSWALLNSFTDVAKRNPTIKQLQQIKGFFSLLPIAG